MILCLGVENYKYWIKNCREACNACCQAFSWQMVQTNVTRRIISRRKKKRCEIWKYHGIKKILSKNLLNRYFSMISIILDLHLRIYYISLENNAKHNRFSRFLILKTYLWSTATEALYIWTSLSKIFPIVENFLVTSAWLMLHVVQGTNFTLSLDVQLLRLDLKVTPRPSLLSNIHHKGM